MNSVGKLFLLFCFALSFLASSAQLQNINVSGGSLFEGEPFLAMNPVNSQNLVIAWMGVTISGGLKISIKTKASFDGGLTWGNYHVQPHASASFHSADVSMCFRNDGTLFLSYIDYRQNPDSGVVFLSRSPDGGISWLPPTEVWNLSEDTVKKPIDRPWLVCDRSATLNNGMLYMTSKPAPWVPAPNRPYLKSSSDSGFTWSNFRFVDTTNYLTGNLIQAPMGALTTSADGALCIAYPSYLVSQSVFPKIYFAKSYNRGLHFQYTELMNNPVFAGDTNLKSGYCLVANPVDPDKLAYAFVGGQNGDADIFICSTSDGGIVWSNPVRVNDDIISNGKLQDLVWAGYNATGDLLVTWRDRRNGSGTGFYQPCETYFSVSHDNGAHFSANLIMSTAMAPFDSALSLDGNDFMSCHYVGDTMYAAWGDVRDGNIDIYFAKVSDSTGVSTGINQVSGEKHQVMEIFPVPAKNSVTVSLPSIDQNAQIEMVDETGKVVYQKKRPKRKEVIDCSRFAPGMIYVIFTTENYSEKQKLLIVK